MKKIRRIAWLFAFVFLFPCVSVSAESMYSTVVLNIREKPSMASEVVGQYATNDKVAVGEDLGEWTEVTYGGKTRFVASRYLSEDKVTTNYISYSVTDDTGYKSYMDRSCITSKSSPQYKLKSEYKITDDGLCTVDGRYCIAMGSYYAKKIGTKIDIVLEYKGEKTVIPCILGDQKANSDTDSEHKKHESDGSYLEFIVRTKELPRMARRMGDVSYAIDSLKGKLVEVRVYE